ncbi:heme lyase CcmF/NrfE family subunit [Chloroflexota bacterium]
MATIGYTTLIVALIVAISSVIAALVGARRGSSTLSSSARTGILAVTVLYTLAMAILLYAFITKDFSLKIISQHSSQDLPTIYTLSALYADKTGSIFLWGWLISILAAVLALQKHNVQQHIMPYAFAILAIIEVFFLVLVTILSNVFAVNPTVPADGYGLNPLLQSFAMLIHPPLLYLGFAGFAVVFAVTMSALINRSTGSEWIVSIRRWSLFAWCMIGLGNLIGMWWAYIELGWGGYWAWDPVENAGLMPWLLASAFLHSIALRRQRNYLQTWSLALIIFTFVFTLLSPFITHGGIESPLHGFVGSSFPAYILAAMLVTLVASLTLLYFRRKGLNKEQQPLSFFSRERAFLLTNIILVVIVFLTLAGTVLPSVIEALGGSRLVLDRGFFDRWCGPIMLALVLLMGICPLLGWGKSHWNSIKPFLLFTLPVILVIAVVVLITGVGNWYALLALVCGFPLLTILLEWFRSTRARHQSQGVNYIKAFFSIFWGRRARYGGFIVHIGIILITIGIVGSSIYDIERTATLDTGESMEIGKYQLTYDELTLRGDAVKMRAIASISVSSNGRFITTMYPEYDKWFKTKQTISEVAIRTTATEDLFVSLAWTSFDLENTLATIRVLVNPLIVWIWVGGGLLLLGGVVSFSLPGNKLTRIKD